VTGVSGLRRIKPSSKNAVPLRRLLALRVCTGILFNSDSVDLTISIIYTKRGKKQVMKFKTLFLLFNLIILLSFGFIFLMPLPILGWEYALSFWGQNWPIAVLFLAVLGGLDGYFVSQWKLFSLLEREDWAGLRTLLEAELAKKGTLGIQKTRIFLNACLIAQNPGRISELREVYVAKKVPFLPKVALSLGLPLVLEGKSEQVVEFFGPLSDSRKTGSDGPWIRWSLAMAKLLQTDTAAARPLLEAGLKDGKQPLLQLLSLYLLDNLRASDDSVRALVDRERPLLASRLTDKEWANHIDGLKEKVILVLFMEKLIGDARRWLVTVPEGATA
jgi:hypothetical protein